MDAIEKIDEIWKIRDAKTFIMAGMETNMLGQVTYKHWGKVIAKIARLQEENDEFKEVLQNAINQACLVWADETETAPTLAGKGYKLDSMALTSYADAMRLLAKHGRLIIKKEVGRRVIGEWVKKER